MPNTLLNKVIRAFPCGRPLAIAHYLPSGRLFRTSQVLHSLTLCFLNNLYLLQKIRAIILLMNTEKLALATKILKNAGCTEVYLFGSQATGRANENSDVDLGVKGLPASVFFGIHYDLEQALRMRVDLVDFDFQKDFYNLLNDIGELKKIG